MLTACDLLTHQLGVEKYEEPKPRMRLEAAGKLAYHALDYLL